MLILCRSDLQVATWRSLLQRRSSTSSSSAKDLPPGRDLEVAPTEGGQAHRHQVPRTYLPVATWRSLLQRRSSTSSSSAKDLPTVATWRSLLQRGSSTSSSSAKDLPPGRATWRSLLQRGQAHRHQVPRTYQRSRPGGRSYRGGVYLICIPNYLFHHITLQQPITEL